MRHRNPRDRIAIAAVFIVHGAVGGGLAARLPALSGNLHLSPGTLGIALLMPAVGSLTTMPFTGWAIHRLGGRATTRLLLALWGASLALPALAVNLWSLIPALVVYGAAAGSSDVAMNAQAVAIEERAGRPIMSGLHGLWSVGSFAGSGIGALAALFGIGYRPHLTVAAAALTVLALLASGALPAAPSPSKDAPLMGDGTPAPRRFSLPTGIILLLGLVAFCAAFAEGSGIDWSAIYLNRVNGAGQAVAASAYTTFACVMAVMRLSGDAIVHRLGPVRAVRIGGVVAVAGGALIVAAWGVVPAFAGFALLGAGIATVIPLAFTAAGRTGRHPGQAIAGVATVSYSASLLGPAVIGGVADASSLRVAFAAVAALPVFIALGAGLMRGETRSASDPP